METKHTTGQWEADTTTSGSISIWNSDERDNGTLIASVYYEAKESEANAKLISASPLLLSTLMAVLDKMDEAGDININRNSKVISEIFAAIKAATI